MSEIDNQLNEQPSPEKHITEGAKNIGNRGLDYGKKKAGQAAKKAFDKTIEKGAEKAIDKGAEKAAEYGAGAAASAAATPAAGAAAKAGVKAAFKIKKATLDKIIPKKTQYICCGISCILSSCGIFFIILFAAVFILAAANEKDESNKTATTDCGFDTSKLAKYEDCNGESAPMSEVTAPTGKDYAISIGVPAEDIKIWNPADVDNLIRAEIAKQWPSVADKHGSTQADAQQAILSYAHHEGGLPKFVEKNGNIQPETDPPSGGCCCGGDVSSGSDCTFSPLSISKDKYRNCKNKAYAVAWDIKYAIYLGVKENLDAFQNKVTGEGKERWKNAIGYVFLPSYPNCYWNNNPYQICRASVSQKEWDNFANETDYVCPKSSGEGPSTGSHQDLANFYTNQLGYTVTIGAGGFCAQRRGTSRCPGVTNGCQAECASSMACHFGYDFMIHTESPVVAAYPGTVVQFWGNYGVVIQSKDKTHYVAYNHMNLSPDLHEGMTVNTGTVLGTIDGANHLDVKKFTDLNQAWACTAFNW